MFLCLRSYGSFESLNSDAKLNDTIYPSCTSLNSHLINIYTHMQIYVCISNGLILFRSLQLKKRRLEEERERSLQQTENGESKSDLVKNEWRGANNEKFEETEIGIKPEDKSSPELVAADEASEEASDKDQQSVNESSSTDPKHSCSLKNSAENEDKAEPVRTGTVKTEPLQTGSIKEEPDKCAEERPVREDSCNGSSDSVEKPPIGVTMKVEPLSESAELVESVAESKGGEERTKENSDVQSSVRKKVDDIVVGGCSSGDEREKENRSPAVKEIPVESQPLIAFLEKIRSHKLGSMFERRLESQVIKQESRLFLLRYLIIVIISLLNYCYYVYF